MYRQPILLNSETHRMLRVAPVRQFDFARQMNSMIILGQEFSEAAKQYPLLFTRDAGGRMIPVVILGTRENLFVDAGGSWEQGFYLPAYVRRYPYILAENEGEGDTLTVCIDGEFAGFDAAGGERLFTDDGEQTPFLENALAFLRLYQEQFRATTEFVACLEGHALFKAMDATVTPEQGERITIGGLFVVDEEALWSLSDSALADLARKGYLAWVYAHLFSLNNFNMILNRMGNVVPQETA